MKIDDFKNSKQAGKFTVGPSHEVYGELTLAGENSSLFLRDDKAFNVLYLPDHYIQGVFHDLTKVSLIHCVTTSGLGSRTQGDEKYHFATIFPHYVIRGNQHIRPDEKTIVEVQFEIDDASTLFYDFDAFGFLIDARPFIEMIANANALPRTIATGPDPSILYFAGKREIFAADTALGRISACHNPSHNWGGPDGIRLSNTISVNIQFNEPVIFGEALDRTSVLISYLGLLVGRPQNLLTMMLRVEPVHQDPAILDVYWSFPPNREPSNKKEKTHPSDVLLDAVTQPETFSQVLSNWIDRHVTWRDARSRFFNSFDKQFRYDVDRLIGSANMFDILPNSAAPSDVPLSAETTAKQESARIAFRSLPQSPERDSILGALGRMGKSNLKHKIRHRAQLITETVDEKFPQLVMVTDEAVNCRNYYVHGGPASFDYNENFNMVTFFVETLEFVFGASDLIEAGWDIAAWSKRPTGMSHPFARFRVPYGIQLCKLKALLSP